jgi:hypothetical protein
MALRIAAPADSADAADAIGALQPGAA